MVFDINTKAYIELTAKLGGMHRSALPLAVRGALNNAAFETKRLVPIMASRKFITRNRSFFRAFSSVEMARGFHINSMQATTGINSAKGSQTAEGLEKQERGGNIKGRKLIPHDKGRVSGSHEKRLRRKNRFSNINISKQGNKRKGSINYLLIKKGSKGTVFEIKQVGRKRKLIPIYVYRSSRVSRVKATPFMKPAAFIARRQIASFYVQQAERQIKRLKR